MLWDRLIVLVESGKRLDPGDLPLGLLRSCAGFFDCVPTTLEDITGERANQRIGALADSSMVATLVGSVRAVVCVSPRLLEVPGELRSPDDLLKLPCVTIDAPSSSPHWRFRKPGSAATLEVPVISRLSVTTTEAAAQAAMLGVGATRLLRYQAVSGLETGALRIVLEAFELDPLPVNLLHVSVGQMPVKMRRFLDFAAPELRNILRRVG